MKNAIPRIVYRIAIRWRTSKQLLSISDQISISSKCVCLLLILSQHSSSFSFVNHHHLQSSVIITWHSISLNFIWLCFLISLFHSKLIVFNLRYLTYYVHIHNEKIRKHICNSYACICKRKANNSCCMYVHFGLPRRIRSPLNETKSKAKSFSVKIHCILVNHNQIDIHPMEDERPWLLLLREHTGTAHQSKRNGKVEEKLELKKNWKEHYMMVLLL